MAGSETGMIETIMAAACSSMRLMLCKFISDMARQRMAWARTPPQGSLTSSGFSCPLSVSTWSSRQWKFDGWVRRIMELYRLGSRRKKQI